MPIIEGPIATLLIAIALVAAMAAWIARSAGRRRTRPPPEPDDIDREELDLAEREVRDLETGRRPDEDVEDDDREGDDWGPGAGGRRG